MRASQTPVARGAPLAVNITLFLSRAARQRPLETALFLGRAPWATYAQLARRVASMAAGLRGARGLKPGERVALVMSNVPEYLEAMYAVWWAGLVAVPVNAKLHPREVRFILADAQSRLVFASADWHSALREALCGLDPMPAVIEAGSPEYAALCGEATGEPAPVAACALAWLFYTSGTTGRPKGAMLSHGNLARMTQSYFASVDAVSPAGRLLHAAPMSHGSGFYTFTHLSQGAAQVVPESGAFDPAETLELLAHHERASLFAAPTMVRRLTEAASAGALRAPGLQTLVYGGGPMYLTDIRAALDTIGNRFAQIYGQGESPMTITALTKAQHGDRAHPRYLERHASVGVAQDDIELAIRDPGGRDLPTGEVGEVCVRGGTVMAGYWNQPDATARALRDGWLWTGDLGELDADGFLTLKDRSKDVIISGGANIYPREVEEVLLRHPAVAEVAVVGRPDPEWGEAVVAFVVARGDPPPIAELDRLCLDHIARFMRPRDYRFVERLPKNNYGKVVKTELRATFAAR